MTRTAQIYGFANSQVDCEFFNEDLYEGIIIGAKWADEHPKEKMINLDKACKWLEMHYTNYMIQDLSKYIEDVCSFDIFSDSFIEDFRKAMEE